MSKESYLDRNLEKSNMSAEGEANAYTALLRPFGRVEYKEKDSVDLEDNNFRLTFSYSPLEVNALPGVNQEFLKKGLLDPKELRILEGLSLINKKNGGTLDLREILPPGYRVIFIPKGNAPLGGNADVESKTIYVWGDLTKPKNVLNLLHEIGHGFDYERLTESDKKDFLGAYKAYGGEGGRNPDKKTLEKVLRSERNAWAFALKKIKPLFDNSSVKKKDILSFIHNNALSNHSAVIRQRIMDGLEED